MIIVKFGGAAITRKDLECTLRNGVFIRLCHQLADYLKDTKEKCILVLGAGSFGYPFLEKIKNNPENKFYYVSKVQYYMTKLIAKASKILIEDGVPSIPITSIVFGEEFINHIKKLVDNFVPVIHGSFNSNLNVLSGDTQIKEIAKKLNPERIIFVTDVDGVYDKDPKKHPDAKLIPIIEKGKFWKDNLMGFKLKEISEIPCEVGIVNGLKKDAFKRALYYRDYGTKII